LQLMPAFSAACAYKGIAIKLMIIAAERSLL